MPEGMKENPFMLHEKILTESPAKGLPELVNVDGTSCECGCATQAWSNACILEAYKMWTKLNK